jgi:prevent-host-death family protein
MAGILGQLGYIGYLNTMQVNVLQAKNRLSELIKAAFSGEEVVIANRGQPVVRLVPTRTSMTAPAGNGRAILHWLQGNPPPAYARRSDEEINADIRNEREAWD